MKQTAGNGNPGGSSTSLGGSGVPAGITINNSGDIILDLSGIQVGGGGGILGYDPGGTGLSGGSGGSSAGVAITNSGQITADVSSSSGFIGIAAQSVGGDGSTNGNNANGNGGNAGPASVASSAPISVTFGWADGSGTNRRRVRHPGIRPGRRRVAATSPPPTSAAPAAAQDRYPPPSPPAPMSASR